MLFVCLGLEYRKERHIKKVQKIYNRVKGGAGYRVPALPDKADKESVRIVLEQDLVDDADREQFSKSSRFL